MQGIPVLKYRKTLEYYCEFSYLEPDFLLPLNYFQIVTKMKPSYSKKPLQ